jgi:2,2-dialkylglycine decarboxylase (pyruvate)
MKPVEFEFSPSNSHADLIARDSATVLGWRYGPAIQFDRGEGIFIYDVDGKPYFDLTAGMMCNVLGHCHPELVETMRAEAGNLWHQSSWYSNPHIVRFAERIVSTLPDGLDVVNFTVTGSEANEVAMRMALAATGKYDILSVIRGLHGGSLAVESVTSIGGARRRNLGPLLSPANAPAIYPPFCYRCPVNLEYPKCDVACLEHSRELIDHITSGDIAAILAETMLVAGGMVVPPAAWLPRLKELAREQGALLVLDEAQLAPARTGKMWGFEHYDVVPDIVTFAKGMSAGVAICGTATTREIAEQSRGKAGLPWAGTYSGDPLPAAVADKQLEIVLRDRLDERAAITGAKLQAGLEGLATRHEVIGDVRGKGLYQMLDIVSDRESRTPDPAMAERIRHNASLAGVIMICVKNFIRICPPVTVTEPELDEIIARLDLAVQRSVDGFPTNIDFTSSSSLAPSQS